MANPKSQPPTEPQASEGPFYPAIEGFIERATQDEISALFASIKDGLEQLKGPKVELAKKVQKAIAATEELLAHLLEVREKLEAERKEWAKGRR